MGAAHELRMAIRRGEYTGLTTARAPGYVQANLVVLPEKHAADFLSFCELNAAACPVLGVSAPGSPCIPSLADDLDIRLDLPGYLIHRSGAPAEEVSDITNLWRSDLVAVAIGCWFSMDLRWPVPACVFGTWSWAFRGRFLKPVCRRAAPVFLAVRWWCRCGRLRARLSIRCGKSPAGFCACMAHRFMRAIPPRSVLQTLGRLILVKCCSRFQARCRFTGLAALRRWSRLRTPVLNFLSPMRPGKCWLPTFSIHPLKQVREQVITKIPVIH